MSPKLVSILLGKKLILHNICANSCCSFAGAATFFLLLTKTVFMNPAINSTSFPSVEVQQTGLAKDMWWGCSSSPAKVGDVVCS